MLAQVSAEKLHDLLAFLEPLETLKETQMVSSKVAFCQKLRALQKLFTYMSLSFLTFTWKSWKTNSESGDKDYSDSHSAGLVQ